MMNYKDYLKKKGIRLQECNHKLINFKIKLKSIRKIMTILMVLEINYKINLMNFSWNLKIQNKVDKI